MSPRCFPRHCNKSFISCSSHNPPGSRHRPHPASLVNRPACCNTQTGFSPHPGGPPDSLLKGGGGNGGCVRLERQPASSHFFARGQEMIGSVSAGLSQGSSSPLVSARLPAVSMSSSSGNLQNKRLPCKSLCPTQSCLFPVKARDPNHISQRGDSTSAKFYL